MLSPTPEERLEVAQAGAQVIMPAVLRRALEKKRRR
jgi:hypothetical protein